MKEWADLQEFLSHALSDFLLEILPEIGGESWWEHYVLDQLTPGQIRSVRNFAIDDIRGLDLAALIRVAERNWSEFELVRPMKQSRSLLAELKNARNRYAHAPVGGVSLEDSVRDVDTVRRLLQVIGANAQILEYVTAIYQKLLLDFASGLGNQQQENIESNSELIQSTPSTQMGYANDPKSGSWLVDAYAHTDEIQKAISNKTYVGIDFGTSTSVVSIILVDSFGQMRVNTLNIDQPEEYGGTISYHLVNTVLAWHKDRLLFGQDAYRLRQKLFEGKNIFSSFKMRLGIDIGPTYPETVLPRGFGVIAIEDANDATREFFKLLATGIKTTIAKNRLPSELYFAVTVPASFEANQRRDLLENMKDAGLEISASCLIDEPNAAFLSFLHESAKGEVDHTLMDMIKKSSIRILVYDFGAGTCDVSILEVSIANGKVSSRNRAISRFMALGGDDFDRAIARNVLLPQLLSSAPEFDPELRDIEERLIPRLQPTAERLKVFAVKWLVEHGVTTFRQIYEQNLAAFEDLPIPAFKIRGHGLSLKKPTLTLRQLGDAIRPFVDKYDPNVSTAHVFAPVADAIDKSGLEAKNLDAVLFIGGSASNPVVRATVMSHLPRSVRAIVPQDLRSHVSLGAALHSLGFHAFDFDLIRPITSEPIFVITRGGKRETIVPAASEVPSPKKFQTRLRVNRFGQLLVELPICVSSEEKLLGLLKIESPDEDGFNEGDEVLITASITHEKLLDIKAEVAGVKVTAALMNPLANRELTPAETRMLEAKQKFNEALLVARGRPPKEVVIEYAQAALDAGAYEIAGDMFVAVERIDPSEDRATSICHAYSQAGRNNRSKEWARRAYERHPDALTAYNLSCDTSGVEREKFLRESLQFDRNYYSSLLALGKTLMNRGDPEGQQMLEKCVSLLVRELDNHYISKSGCRRLIEAAKLIKKHSISERAKARLDKLSYDYDHSLYDEENLAASINQSLALERA